MSNALQAVLDRAAKEPEGKTSRPAAASEATPRPRPAAKRRSSVERVTKEVDPVRVENG